MRNDNQWKTTVKSCYDLSFIIRHSILIISTDFIISVCACEEWLRILDIEFFWIRISSKSLSCYTFSTSSSYLIKLFFLIMIASFSFFIQFKIVRYLLLHWRSNIIAAEVHCHVFVVYKIQINFFVYERFTRSQILWKTHLVVSAKASKML